LVADAVVDRDARCRVGVERDVRSAPLPAAADVRVAATDACVAFAVSYEEQQPPPLDDTYCARVLA